MPAPVVIDMTSNVRMPQPTSGREKGCKNRVFSTRQKTPHPPTQHSNAFVHPAYFSPDPNNGTTSNALVHPAYYSPSPNNRTTMQCFSCQTVFNVSVGSLRGKRSPWRCHACEESHLRRRRRHRRRVAHDDDVLVDHWPERGNQSSVMSPINAFGRIGDGE